MMAVDVVKNDDEFPVKALHDYCRLRDRQKEASVVA